MYLSLQEVRNASAHDLNKAREQINDEIDRRNKIQSLVEEINEKLYELYGECCENDHLDVVSNLTGEVFISNDDVCKYDCLETVHEWSAIRLTYNHIDKE